MHLVNNYHVNRSINSANRVSKSSKVKESLSYFSPGSAKKHVFGVSQTLALCIRNHVNRENEPYT